MGSSLDREDLLRLRRLVAKMSDSEGPLPMESLVSLSAALPEGSGLTVDLEAAEELGFPMVVLRPATVRAELWERLSKREREVAACIARGLANKEIASELSISLGTVKDHVHHILDKSGLPNRTAVALAVPLSAEEN